MSAPRQSPEARAHAAKIAREWFETLTLPTAEDLGSLIMDMHMVYRDAYRKGQEDMRDRAAHAAYEAIYGLTLDCGCHHNAEEAVRALEIEEPK